MNENDDLPTRYKLKYFYNIKNRLLVSPKRRRSNNRADSNTTAPPVRGGSGRGKQKS